MRYKKPRRINLVSMLVWLLVVGAVYGALRFGPIYYRSYQAKAVLTDAANRALRVQAGSFEGIEHLREETLQQLRALRIADGDLDVQIVRRETDVVVTAIYQETVRHPVIERPSVLHFAPSVTRAQKAHLDGDP